VKRKIDKGTEACGCRYEGQYWVERCVACYGAHLAALQAHWAACPEVVPVVPPPPDNLVAAPVTPDNTDLL
jgi:hypothetical protein